MCKPIRMVWSSESQMREESWEKMATFSRLIGKGGIPETLKKADQKDAQMQVCLILSVILPQENTHPLFLH